MNKKIKIALFSATFLTISALSVQAMDQESRPTRRGAKLTDEEQKAADARKKAFLNKNSRNISTEPKSANLFKSFDVNSPDFQNVINFYKKPRDCEEFEKLVEYFASVPQKYKLDAINHLESNISIQNKRKLGGLKYTPQGKVEDTPTKIKGTVPLREKLLQPLDEPKEIQLEATDDDF